MANLPNADWSPRVENGIMYWYAGDTGAFNIDLELTDADGEPLETNVADTVVVAFKNAMKQSVHTFTLHPSDGQITLTFSTAVTAKFNKGHYTYDITYTRDADGKVTTLARGNEAVVE